MLPYQDKDAKIGFLQKAIDVVIMVTGEPLAVKPARIVAGHEPERTNELLQAIAKCCLNKVGSLHGALSVDLNLTQSFPANTILNLSWGKSEVGESQGKGTLGTVAVEKLHASLTTTTTNSVLPS